MMDLEADGGELDYQRDWRGRNVATFSRVRMIHRFIAFGRFSPHFFWGFPFIISYYSIPLPPLDCRIPLSRSLLFYRLSTISFPSSLFIVNRNHGEQ